MSYRKLGTEFTSRTNSEIEALAESRQLLLEYVEQMGPKWDVHLPVFLSAPSLARMLWQDMVYRKALDVPGCLVEFGSQWGASLNVFLLLKQIHEPWNAGRRILSFSIFEEGFRSVDAKDGPRIAAGDYRVANKWDERLRGILNSHSARSPLGPGQNFEVIAGDARKTFRAYLKEHPEIILSHVHFDLDIYKPTRDLIAMCKDRMPKGAILIFDELNCPSFPGETVALDEMLQIANLSLRKSPFQPFSAYAIVGE